MTVEPESLLKYLRGSSALNPPPQLTQVVTKVLKPVFYRKRKTDWFDIAT
uniref:Uncharacterized protein n=1 Tax=uncultured Chromatiales bacterium HF0200_41F04 TaxID=710740 RepID=E0XV21_9GAMM|nr:hypothetical protein [uncultured Chromatiales bacterium HF0200_41F04]